MKLVRCLFAVVLATLLVACGGKGSPAAAPTGLAVTSEDGQITLNWDVVSGVTYRVYCAPGSAVDNSTAFFSIVGHVSKSDGQNLVLPPFTLDPVQNGTLYACTVDGRYNGGPAGPSAPSRTATGRLAGSNWQQASATGLGSAFRAVTVGTLAGFTADKFFAVGTSGRLQVADSYASGTWSDVTLPSTVASAVGDLNTATVYGKYLFVAGSGGTVAFTNDLQTWQTVSLGGVIRQLVSNGLGTRMVAVGDAGLIRYSADGVNWATPTVSWAGTSPDLTSAAYSEAGYWVAVGSSGSVLVSANADASSWSAATGNTGQTANLSSVASLKVQTPNTVNYAYKLVAVGANGALGYSGDGQNWSWQSLGATNLAQVVGGQQTLVQIDTTNSRSYGYVGGLFMVAGAGGKVWRSGETLTWDNASWTDLSGSTGTSVNAASLLHYVKLSSYSPDLGRDYSWLLYGTDGTGRYAR